MLERVRPPPFKVLQPEYVQRFGCIGADCEDTCCAGWGVRIDRATFEKYLNHAVPDIRARLSSLVVINPASTSSSDFAKIQLDGIRCPAIRNGLCSVQQAFGEPYLSDMCSTFPRVLNMVDGVLERSLNLSCPEAARLVLTIPGSMTFEKAEEEHTAHRVGSVSLSSTAENDGLNEVRELVLELLQERTRPLWKRLTVLGYAMEELSTPMGSHPKSGAEIVRKFLAAMRQGNFDQIPESNFADHALQLETVTELIVKRISSEYASPRFLQCYSDFIRGVGWNAESTMEDVVGRYRVAFLTFWSPLASKNEHMLENYLVSYAFRNLFPFGGRKADQKVVLDAAGTSIWNEYILLIAHYALVRTLLVGMSGLHRHAFGVEHVVRLIQSYTKAFQHSGSFTATIIQLLMEKGLKNPRVAAALARD
jgi:lysine-N-methylase